MKKTLPNWLIWAFSILAFIGFLDASYLTISHYTGASLSCGLTGGCDKVTSSEYSSIFGIPVALGGVFYYLTVLLSSLYYFDRKDQRVIKFLCFFPIAGLLASAYFVYLQLFVILAICQYCMLSATTSTLLFILGMLTYAKFSRASCVSGKQK